MENIFWQRASGMSCAATSAESTGASKQAEFDERSRENNYDLLYKNECQNWRNKINRAKNTNGFPADRLEKIQATFADFKKEALQRKIKEEQPARKNLRTGCISRVM